MCKTKYLTINMSYFAKYFVKSFSMKIIQKAYLYI